MVSAFLRLVVAEKKVLSFFKVLLLHNCVKLLQFQHLYLLPLPSVRFRIFQL